MYTHERERKAEKGVVLEYQLQNRVENLADVSARCSGLLQGEERKAANCVIVSETVAPSIILDSVLEYTHSTENNLR